jgi:predicted dithiol-disulfide oxidoreductase (DUF899 family)
MFGPDYKAGCPSCSAIADGFNGIAIHLINHDVMFWAVSRAPLAKLNEYKRRMVWTFPWASSFGSDFNFDFDVSFTEEQQRKGIEYNYRCEPPMEPRGDKAPPLSSSAPEGPISFAAASGTDVNTYTRERPGMSAFVFITRILLFRAESTAFGECINGSIARRKDATKMAISGGAATMSTESTPTCVASN